jgi:hypothetical protein
MSGGEDDETWSMMFEDDGLEEIEDYGDENIYMESRKEDLDMREMWEKEQEWLRVIRDRYVVPVWYNMHQGAI